MHRWKSTSNVAGSTTVVYFLEEGNDRVFQKTRGKMAYKKNALGRNLKNPTLGS